MTPSHSFIVVCEGAVDREVSIKLAVRTLSELADWLSSESLAFRGIDDGERFSTWAGISHRENVPKHKGFKEGWGPDTETARRALHLASTKGVSGVILLRDADKADAESKRSELEAAVRAFRSTEVGAPLPVATGVAMAKVEAWLLAAQDLNAHVLPELLQELGFNPVVHAEELTASDAPQAKRSAKRVLARLSTLEQALELLATAALDVLLKHGEKTGLPEFLCELRCGLGPVMGHVPSCEWCRCSD
ncbi:MAG: hypothetical protein Q8N23_11435 [Archangium sp.]|nr:hypothetical protein [Archangium sp.]MDP3569633.1 hypothetical protein [Archangium sp.]